MSERNTWGTFVPAVDDTVAPPPMAQPFIEYPPKPPGEAGLGFVVVSANFLVTFILFVGMLVNGQAVPTALIVGAAHFLITTPVYVLIVTGSLASIVATRQHHRTERYRIDAYSDLAEMALQWRISVEENKRAESLMLAAPAPIPADTPQGVYTPPTYVAAYNDANVALVALAWASGLYGDDGLPSRKQVHADGGLRGRMLGSARDNGNREAGIWLMQKRIILRAPNNGRRLNVERYPTRAHLQSIR